MSNYFVNSKICGKFKHLLTKQKRAINDFISEKTSEIHEVFENYKKATNIVITAFFLYDKLAAHLSRTNW